jgi:hypothetical protein
VNYIALLVHKSNHCVILVLMFRDLSTSWCGLSRASGHRVIFLHSFNITRWEMLIYFMSNGNMFQSLSQEITFSGRLQRVARCVRRPHHAQFPSPRKNKISTV